MPLEVVEADRPVRIVSPLGETLPLHCTAAGKVQLAFADRGGAEGAACPTRSQKYHRRTPAPTAPPCMQQLKTVGDERLRDRHGRARRGRARRRRARSATTRAPSSATLAVAGPAYRFQAERIDKELAPLVVKAGRDLSSRLGFDTGKREAG